MNEKISALLDGELRPGEHQDVPTSELADTDARQALSRYQLIGSLLRNECADSSVDSVKSGLADKISARIADEPEWLLPVNESTNKSLEESLETAGQANNVVVLSSRKPAFFSGFAAAAAISALAIFVGAPQWLSPSAEPTAILAQAEKQKPSVNQWQNTEASQEDSLNTFLVEHGEFTSSTGLNGLLAYAKFVSYDSDQ